MILATLSMMSTMRSYLYSSRVKKVIINTWVLLGVICACFVYSADDPTLDRAITLYYQNKIEQAEKLLREPANNSNPIAQYYLGLIYLKHDPALAQPYFLQAAQQDHSEAMFQLAQVLENSAQPNALINALDWYRKSRLTTNQQAAPILLMQDGHDVSEDTIRKTLITEANRGDVDAMMQLAIKFDSGTSPDVLQAIHWFQKAASMGNHDAMLWLGFYHCKGVGVDKNSKNANLWFAKSQRQIRCEK